MKKLQAVFILCLLGCGLARCYAQPYFKWYDSIKVKTDVNFIDNPWAGGLNFVQLSNIDLDMDGTKDLFTFDRTGNKIRTFIKKGSAGTVSYRYDPSYERKFPVIYEWVLLADYNCDGKEDIFCYSSIGAGFDVYKNTSTPSTGLQFQKVVTQQLSAFYPDAPPSAACSSAKRCNLYVSATDVPALSDIDNDGDLDVVTFDIFSGSHMLYHKNMSKEQYQSCDSLIFQVANHCWGYATENALNNNYTLHDTCFDNVVNPQLIPDKENNGNRHSGSAELCMDLDGDGDKEFITGDIAFNNLTMLTNGGTPTNSNFVKIDVAFPASNNSTIPVDMTIFPCPFSVDADGDGLKDLLVSPNATNACENFNSVAYYKNTGSNSVPVFQHIQNNLLQDQQIDLGEGAYPVFFDYNNDGLQDLFIGNYGYYGVPFQPKIALFKNTGSLTDPRFELITRDYDNLNASGLVNMVPTFGDLDGDGDADMIIGDYVGNLHYFQNTAASGAEAKFVLLQTKLKNSKNFLIDVGDFAVPQIVDMDNDGKNDLIIGGRNGKVAYYHNTGTGTTVPVFDSITVFLGQISVSNPTNTSKYSYPFVFKDKSGVTKMLIGSVDGTVYLYDHIDNNLTGKFKLVDSLYQDIYQSTRTAPHGADINNDGYMDLIVGNYQGGVSFYKGTLKNVIGIDTYDNFIHFNYDLYPNPANGSVTLKINDEHSSTYLVEIYNVMGQFIGSHIIANNQLNIDTQSMQQGMYLYKVYEVDGYNTKKSGALIKRLIIQH